MTCHDPDLEQSPPYQLWLATNAWQRVIRKKLEPLGLTHVQFVVLASVAKCSEWDDSVTQAKISRFAALDENMTSQVLRLLERRGLVMRVDHPTDKRANRIELTDGGREVATGARALVREASSKFFSTLGVHREEFVESLRRLHSQAEA